MSYKVLFYWLIFCCPHHHNGDIIVDVTSWDFIPQLFSLLNVPDLMSDFNKLDVNQNDPFFMTRSSTFLNSQHLVRHFCAHQL